MSIHRVHFRSAAGTVTTSANPLVTRSVHSLHILSVGPSSGSPQSTHGSSMLGSSIEHDGAGEGGGGRLHVIVFVKYACFRFFTGFVSSQRAWRLSTTRLLTSIRESDVKIPSRMRNVSILEMPPNAFLVPARLNKKGQFVQVAAAIPQPLPMNFVALPGQMSTSRPNKHHTMNNAIQAVGGLRRAQGNHSMSNLSLNKLGFH